MQGTDQNSGLHLDVSLGATAAVIIGALADLKGDINCISQAFDACGLFDVEVVLRRDVINKTSGAFIDFVLSCGDSLRHHTSSSVPVRFSKTSSFRKPIWARSKKLQLAQTQPQGLTALASEFEKKISKKSPAAECFNSWTRGEPATFLEIHQIINESTMEAIAKALATKSVLLLTDSIGRLTNQEGNTILIPGRDAARYLCEIISFAQLIATLSPSSISATRVATSFHTGIPTENNTLDPRNWVLALSQDMPSIDRAWPAPYCDPAGLALMQTVVSRYGTRGESILLRHGIGINNSNAAPFLVAKALLCAPTLISSRPDTSAPGFANLPPLTEISAVIGGGIDVADLLRRLTGLGLKSTHTWQVFESSTYPRLMLKGVIAHSESHLAIEALLVTGEATEVYTQLVESQSLQQRVVAVPFGREQKKQTCKVTEWLWSGKILRADPDTHDLAKLVKLTGHPQEVVRADVLAAWRKWRLD